MKFAAIVLIAYVLSTPVEAQAGSVPNGCHPAGYSGATFTEVVERREPETSEFGLYEGKQNRTIRGQAGGRLRLEEQRRAMHTFTPLQVRNDTVLTVFYMGSAKKLEWGQKPHNIRWIAISLAEINGKKIPEDQRPVIPVLPCHWQISKHFTEKTKLDFAILSRGIIAAG